MKYTALIFSIVLYITTVVFGSASSECTSAPPKIPKFCGRYHTMMILISLLQKCLKNLPVLIINYLPFEKCTKSPREFLDPQLSLSLIKSEPANFRKFYS
jgi:hypothetical protein